MGGEAFGPVKVCFPSVGDAKVLKWERVFGRESTFMQAMGGEGGMCLEEGDNIWNVNSENIQLKYEGKKSYICFSGDLASGNICRGDFEKWISMVFL